MRNPFSSPEGRRVALGDREIIAAGISPSVWGDLHHQAMTMRWPTFFVVAALIFILFNLGFATLYLLGDDPIANARPGVFIDYFFFSIETFATVGYGDMHPRTIYGHSIAAIGAFTGVSSLAVTTGLIFARFSRPRARVLFAHNPVVATLDGAPTLMVRFANARSNMIVDAGAKLWLTRIERTVEGQTFRRLHKLKLVRDESPMFALSWSIMHVIDDASPLAGWSAADFAACDATLVVILEGHDETSSVSLHARRNYAGAEVLWNREYVDVMRVDAEGRVMIDYTRLHETRPSIGALEKTGTPA